MKKSSFRRNIQRNVAWDDFFAGACVVVVVVFELISLAFYALFRGHV